MQDDAGKTWPTWVAIVIAMLLLLLAGAVMASPYGDGDARTDEPPAATQPSDESEADDAADDVQPPTTTCAKKTGKKRKKSLVMANAIVDRGQASAAAWLVAQGIYERILAAHPGNRCAAKGLTRLAELEAEKVAVAAAAEAAKAEADAAAKDAKAEEAKAKALAARSWVERLEDGWVAVKKAYVTPFSGAGVVALGALLLFLVLSRLVAGLVVHTEAVSPREPLRRTVWSLGLAALVGAALMTVSRSEEIADMSTATARDEAVFKVALAVIAVATSGIVLMAWARGTRLAMQVQVFTSDGKASEPLAKRAMASLTTLGSQPPRGLRTTGMSDVTALPEDALTDVPAGAVAKAIFQLARVLRSSPPWRLDLVLGGDGLATVAMTRNGRAVDDGTLRLQSSSIPGPSPAKAEPRAGTDSDPKGKPVVVSDDDLVIAAAGHGLVTLAKRHAALRGGLGGAEDWRGLALYALAVNESDVARRRRLLASATDGSPNYALPHLLSIIDGTYTTKDEWRACVRRLRELRKTYRERLQMRPSGLEAFEVRLLYNLAVAWFNLHLFLEAEAQPGVARAWRRADRAARQLTVRCADLSATPGLDAYVERIGPLVDSLSADVRAHNPVAPVFELPAQQPRRASEYYSRACLLAGQPGRETEAVAALAIAVADERLRSAARSDPSFRRFWHPDSVLASDPRQRFKTLVGDEPPAGLLDLEPFKPQATKLKDLGLTDLALFDGLDVAALARAVKVHPTRAARWVELAALDLARTRADPDRWQILALLLALDVDTRAKLDAKEATKETFYKALVAAALKTRVVPTQAQTIDRWWPA